MKLQNKKVTDEEIKAYYDANAKSLVQPEQAKVQYIRVSADALGKLQPVTEHKLHNIIKKIKRNSLAKN